MKNLKLWKVIPVMLVVMSSAHVTSGQQPQPQKKSVESSPSSGTVVEERGRPRPQFSRSVDNILSACNAAADELRASRILIDALETENTALRSRLENEKRANELLIELNETRRVENEALKSAVTAKNETIAAKDAAITAQQKLIEHLKPKNRSPWARIADILLGAGVIAILK